MTLENLAGTRGREELLSLFSDVDRTYFLRMRLLVRQRDGCRECEAAGLNVVRTLTL